MRLNLYNVKLKGRDKSREYFVRAQDFLEAGTEAFVKAADEELDVVEVKIIEIGGTENA